MQKLILSNHQAPGDIVMLTAAVRDLHLCYPNQYLTDVRTNHPELWENNPYLTPLNEQDKEVKVIPCHYPLIHKSNQLPYHFIHGFIEYLNGELGLQIKPTAFKGDIHLTQEEKKQASQVKEVTGEDTPFWIIAAGGKNDFTIKWWSAERYQQVVNHFKGRIQFVQIGLKEHYHPDLEGVIDLRGKTDLRQLIQLVYYAQGIVTPVSLLMHLAAAVPMALNPSRVFGTLEGLHSLRPCVVIAGGREPVHWEAYPGHQFIHTIGALPCCATGGCWKSRTVKLNDGNKNDRSLCVDVVGNLPHCMDMITAEEVIRRVEIYLTHPVLNPSRVPKTLEGLRSGKLRPKPSHNSSKEIASYDIIRPKAFHRNRDDGLKGILRLPKYPKLWMAFSETREIASPPQKAGDRNDANEAFILTEKNALQHSERFIQSIPNYPGNYEGKGIVICGGGVKLFTNAWVCINMLRDGGCELPIQLWYLGPGEIDEDMQALVKLLNVECVDALELRKTVPARILKGWELKAYAILNSSFKELLLLDADNVPVSNPEYLFETEQYKTTSAIFWPDLGRLAKDRTIWNLCGVPYRNEPEFESGQIVVNKEQCWKALKLAMWYNEHSDFYYVHIHGDKETFHLAFRKMETPYAMIPYPVKLRHGVLYQRDFSDKIIFQHRNGHKWSYHTDNPRLRGFKHHNRCMKFISELQQKWDGLISPDFSKKTKKEKAAIEQLLNGKYQYHRIGYDQRPLTFLPNGKIGKGKASCEQRWDVVEKNGEVKLEIYGHGHKTCTLTIEEGGKWKGRWRVFEKMPVALEPVGVNPALV